MTLSELLELLFETGRVKLSGRPTRDEADDRRSVAELTRAFAIHKLSVAGPPVDFDAGTALAAAHLVADACWFLANHDEPDEELQRSLVMPGPPSSASQHLSADLIFRYLPLVFRRARAYAPEDRLTALLSDLLRQWPLSGVLADVAEGPTTPLQFNDHSGLLLLYAERLAHNDRPAWRPTTGPARETTDLILAGPETTRALRHRGPPQPGSG